MDWMLDFWRYQEKKYRELIRPNDDSGANLTLRKLYLAANEEVRRLMCSGIIYPAQKFYSKLN